MPLDLGNGEIKLPPNQYLPLGNFKRGVITLVNQSNLPKNALAQADNVLLVEDGRPSPRPGVQWYGSVMPNGKAIDGFEYYDDNGSTHLVVVAGGTVYRSVDDGVTWDVCSGAAMTAGVEVNMEQYNSDLYITNGTDVITLYQGTTTLKAYTALTQPAAPTIATTPASPGTGYTYYYKISAVNTIGFSIASNATSVVHGQPRSNWDSTTNYVTLTLPAYQSTQTRYDIYFSEDNLNFYYLDSVTSPNAVYKDDGSAIIIPSTIAPTTDSSTGPLVEELTTVGTRMYGVRDRNNPWRIWFTSGTSPLGSFSDGYDGGYLDWQPGGKFYPVKVADYRDGKGTSIATVWLNSADAQGAIIQMSLGNVTVGALSVTIPSAYKLPGSRGTPAPHSVINVLNDYVFYNQQAFYNLGNRPDLLQILSTDEMSANIRPTVRLISPKAEKNVVAIYYDAKIYISYPLNSSTNNVTGIYDTELQAWIPYAYTIGFSRFLRYTDNGAGLHHLLAYKPGDTRLTEMGTLYTPSQNILGDYGNFFPTNVLTGLYSTEKDRYDFQFVQEMDYEFSNPQGVINVELLGDDHAKGYGRVKLGIVDESNVLISNVGWDALAWDSYPWDYVSVQPIILAKQTSKYYTLVGQELDSVQWHITTSSLGAAYVLRSLQTWGTDTQDAKPSAWRITAQ